jgi:hypothetical protein
MLVAAAAVYKHGENDVFAGAVHGRSGGLSASAASAVEDATLSWHLRRHP